jgi:putative iron-regulated protein
VLAALAGIAAPARAADGVVVAYAAGVHASYEDALAGAVAVRDAIDAFTAEPGAARLAAARRAWLDARDAYGRTEAFRFYEGPIDFFDPRAGLEGPELRLNSWPLDETYIDRLIGDPAFAIEPESLAARNAVDDDAHVSTGWHAIEYLLWGADLDPAGPGARPGEDFAGDGAIASRRREYLRAVADLVVEDLRFLAGEWAPGRDNYAAELVRLDEPAALRRILTGLVQLAGFELSMERLAVPLDSGDQEDEHSCFSDNTHADFAANVQGIRNVWSGTYGTLRIAGLDRLAAEVAPEVGLLVEEQLAVIERSVAELPRPFDAILASPAGSPERRRAEQLVQSLRVLSELLGVLRLEAARVDG